MNLHLTPHRLAPLALALALSTLAGPALAGPWPAWTGAAGDVALTGDGLRLSTASTWDTLEDGPLAAGALNVSGRDPLAAQQAGGLEDFFGLPLGGLDTDPVLGQAYEGSGALFSFALNAGDTLSFSYRLLTRDLVDEGWGLDLAFAVVDGQRYTLASAADASGAAVGEHLAATHWLRFSHTATQTGVLTLGFGVVDIGNYTATSTLEIQAPQLSSVPEPTAAWLVLAGLAGVAGSRRRSLAPARPAAHA